MTIQNLFTSRDNNANASTYVGQVGRIWFNLSDNTFYVSDGSTPGGIAVGGGGGDYGNANVANFLANYGSNVVVTTGNITAGNVITDTLESVDSVLVSAGNGLVDIRATSNVVIKSDSANYEWLFDDAGVLTTPGDIDIGGGLELSAGIVTTATNSSLQAANGGLLSLSSTDSNTTSESAVRVYVDTADNANNRVYIYTDNQGTGDLGTWTFAPDGTLTLPGDTAFMDASANFVGIYADASQNNGIEVYTTNTEIFNTGNVNISANVAGTGKTWTFDNTGVLTAPGNIIANNIGNIASINLDGSASNVLYGNGVFAPAGASSYGNADVATFLADFGSNTIVTTGNITGGNFVGSGAALTSITGANVTGVVGNATSAQNIRIQTLGSGGLDYPVIFSLSSGAANAVSLYIDSDPNHFKYNPTTNLFTVGNASVTTNLTVSFGTFTTSFGNINATSGSINAGARVVATGNVTGGNITTAGQVSATGNITGGNLALTNTMTLGTATVVSGNAIPVTAGVVLLDADDTNSTWTLADGQEGQIMYLVANNTANVTTFSFTITVANLRGLDGSNAAVVTANANWAAFRDINAGSGNVAAFVTTVYAGGAWTINSGEVI